MATLILLLVAGFAGFFLLAYMFSQAFANKITYNELDFENFPASFEKIRIFFISDIHRRKIADEILSTVKGKVDIVIIGGDLTEKGVPLKRVIDNVKKLKALGPVYFVWGNNDYEEDYRLLDATLLENGVKILDNTATEFESEEGERIALLGVDDVGKERDRLDLALSDAKPGLFTILISHNPQIKDKLKREHGVNLVLSGHTHGGQIHIFGYSPYKKGGIERQGETVILTSNGYGTTALPLRLGAPAECHLITIRKAGL